MNSLFNGYLENYDRNKKDTRGRKPIGKKTLSSTEKMKRIKMFGAIVDEFGMSEVEIDAHSKVDALKALDMNLPGFIKYMDEHGYIVVLLDLDNIDVDNPDDSYAEQVTLENASDVWGDRVMCILPATEGEITAGILAGISTALATTATVGGVTVATATVLGTVVMAVTNVAITISVSAIVSLISNAVNATKEADEEANYLFTGAINTSKQGGRMPLLYGGPMMCGSMVLSGRIVSKEEDLDVSWVEKMKSENPDWKTEYLATLAT